MKKLLLNTIYIALFALSLGSCVPEGPDDLGESKLIIAVDPDPGPAIAHALNTSYNFAVKVLSKMPRQGVDVNVVFRQDIDNQIVFDQTYSTTTPLLNVIINNLPFNEVGTVTVTVKSKTDPNNTATKTFKLVRK